MMKSILMLNKELLMGKPQINKVYLTVGNWIQQSIGVYYGFFKSGKEIYGSVSVIPKVSFLFVVKTFHDCSFP